MEIPLHPAAEVREAIECVPVDRQHGKERHQAHNRTDPQMLRDAAGLADHVVVEAVGLVPHPDLPAGPVDRPCDGDEVLEELGGDRLVRRSRARQLQRDGQHVQAEQAHPRRPVGLLQPLVAGQIGPAAVEDADIVQAEEAALEGVAAVGVLAVHPPGEIQQQLVEDLLQEVAVGAALDLAGDLVDAAGGVGVDRRVDVAEIPLVGRELAAGVHVPLAQEQHELTLGPLGVEPG